jgi:hypothetical protein
MTGKYTKNDYMHHLNDSEEPLSEEAKQLIKERLARGTRSTQPQNIGQWLQVTHRDVFNRDFEMYVAAHAKDKHWMS